MGKRGPESSTKRICIACGASLVRGEDENSNSWHHRQICLTQACWEIREQQKVAALAARPNLVEMREVKPWPAGVKFDSLPLARTGPLTIPRPITHRPYGTSASWAVGGGEG